MISGSIIKPAPVGVLSLIASYALIAKGDAFTAPSALSRGNLITLLLLTTQGVLSQTMPDCYHVVSAWNAMGGQPSAIYTSTPECCTMAGIRCASDGKTVLKLIWDSKNLKGSIPVSIGNLRNLTILFIRNNQLTGSIPASIGNLQNLQQLRLNQNQLNGPIPREIGNLKSLVNLVLHNNMLLGSIPQEVGNLANLEEIDISFNKINGSIPSQIGNLTRLKILKLQNNEVSGEVPEETGYLANMQHLDLSFNKINGLIPSQIGNLANLQYISLDTNSISGSIAESIGNLKNLQRLFIRNNQLTGSIPASIGNLQNLQQLRLDQNQLNGSIPREIGNLKSLVHLVLQKNMLLGSIPQEVGNLANLEAIDISFNKINGSIPSQIGNLTRLKILKLQNNELSGLFTPSCGTKVYSTNTNITICGCASAEAPPVIFPPPATPLACLSTGVESPLIKRALVYSTALQGFKLTCNVDDKKNPFQDCLNTMGAICNPTYIIGNTTRIATCKSSVDDIFSRMSLDWQAVSTSCAPWSRARSISGCSSANKNLITRAYYVMENSIKDFNPLNSRVKISSSLTDSINQSLWTIKA